MTPGQARLVSGGSTLAGVASLLLGNQLMDSQWRLFEGAGSVLFLGGAVGLYVGPVGGQLVHGEPLRALASTSLRVGASAMMSSGMTEYACIIEGEWESSGWNDRGPCRQGKMGVIMNWAGLGLFMGSIGFDIWDAGRAPGRTVARLHRRAERRGGVASAVVSPVWVPRQDGHDVGLELSLDW